MFTGRAIKYRPSLTNRLRALLRNNPSKSAKPNTLILLLHRHCLNLSDLLRRLVFDPTPLSPQAQIPTTSPVSSGSPPLVRVPSLHRLARLAPGTPSRSSPNCNTVARSCAPSPSPPRPALSAPCTPVGIRIWTDTGAAVLSQTYSLKRDRRQ